MSPQADTSRQPATDRLVSLIIPTYGEAENLGPLLQRIAAALRPQSINYEIIIVDDNSNDGTEDVVQHLVGDGHPIRLIVRRNERGLSSAVIRGMREAEGWLLFCMDADLSHPPEALPLLIKQLHDPGVDFVIGSRYIAGGSTVEGWGLGRWINSKVATLMARPFTRARDPMAGYFGLPRNVFDRSAPMDPIGYKIGLELMVKCRCKNIREIPIHFANRLHGSSKLSLREQWNYIKHVKRLLDFQYGRAAQFAQFCVVGASGMAMDLAGYSILLYLGVPLAIARGIAIMAAMTWNFMLNRRLAFSYSRTGSVLSQYPKYLVGCGLGGLVSWAVSVSLTTNALFFAGHPIIAAVIGIAIGTIINFALSCMWVFRPCRKSEDKR